MAVFIEEPGPDQVIALLAALTGQFYGLMKRAVCDGNVIALEMPPIGKYLYTRVPACVCACNGSFSSCFHALCGDNGIGGRS